MRWQSLAIGSCLSISSAWFASPAFAVTPEDRAAADQLFKDGRALVKTGAYAQACPKLASSNALDPTAGTQLALGDCYELNGQTASAWATFGEAAATARKAGDTQREDEANRRHRNVEPKLSMLTIAIPPEERVSGLDVKRNGRAVEYAMLGMPFPVDPGRQLIEVTIPGRAPWNVDFVVAARAGTTTVNVPILAPAASTPPAKPASRGLGSQRIAGIVVGSVGVAGLVVGSVFGGLALSTVSDIDDRKLCDDGEPIRCSQEGLDLEDEANVRANVSNVALAVGGAAVITGVVVFFTAPRAKAKPAGAAFEVLPTLSPEHAGLVVRGTF